MVENVGPAFEFVNLMFLEETVRVHGIIRDIVRASALSVGKKVRIAFFYQNDSFDAVIPYCLELLYQTNVVSRRNRYRILLFCGRHYSVLKEIYKDTFFGSGNFCNNLFGLGAVTPSGSIRGEKKIYSHGKKSTKECEDKFLFSSSYSFLPESDIAKTIAAVVILPPSLSNMHKIPQICQWCEENGVPTISIFDPFPTARKIKFYGSMDFIAYGWSIGELEDAAKSAPLESSTPISNPKRLLLLSEMGEVDYTKVSDHVASPLFNSLNSALTEAHKKMGRNYYDKDMLVEAASLSRRLAALSCPLLDYDKEYFGSMFRKPLSERVDNFISMVNAATSMGGVSSEIGKAAHYLVEIKKELACSNPKFNELSTQIGSLISSGLKAIVLIPTQKEADAFSKALANLKIPITENDRRSAGIEIRSFGADRNELENCDHDMALLSTYPFRDKKYLVSKLIAKKAKIFLYPCEISDYMFFSSLYKQIEEKFFTKSRRLEIKTFLSGKGDLTDIKISRITRHEEKAEAELEYGTMKPKDILSVLTDIEMSLDVSAPSLFQESVNKEMIAKAAGGEIKTSGLLIKFHTGDKLYVREEKTVQVLSASDDVVFKIAKDLEGGETLILVNRDMRMSLNELILEKAEEYPKLKVLKVMVGLWVNALKEGMILKGDDEARLLEKMNAMGAGIKSKYTIKHWINGEVIGPRDQKNILRIAEIYNCGSLGENAKAIVASITQMRGLRRIILLRAKNALVEGESKEIEKLGIDLSDFADALEFFRITSIEKVDGIPIERLDKIGDGYEI